MFNTTYTSKRLAEFARKGIALGLKENPHKVLWKGEGDILGAIVVGYMGSISAAEEKIKYYMAQGHGYVGSVVAVAHIMDWDAKLAKRISDMSDVEMLSWAMAINELELDLDNKIQTSTPYRMCDIEREKNGGFGLDDKADAMRYQDYLHKMELSTLGSKRDAKQVPDYPAPLYGHNHHPITVKFGDIHMSASAKLDREFTEIKVDVEKAKKLLYNLEKFNDLYDDKPNLEWYTL